MPWMSLLLIFLASCSALDGVGNFSDSILDTLGQADSGCSNTKQECTTLKMLLLVSFNFGEMSVTATSSSCTVSGSREKSKTDSGSGWKGIVMTPLSRGSTRPGSLPVNSNFVAEISSQESRDYYYDYYFTPKGKINLPPWDECFEGLPPLLHYLWSKNKGGINSFVVLHSMMGVPPQGSSGIGLCTRQTTGLDL